MPLKLLTLVPRLINLALFLVFQYLYVWTSNFITAEHFHLYIKDTKRNVLQPFNLAVTDKKKTSNECPARVRI